MDIRLSEEMLGAAVGRAVVDHEESIDPQFAVGREKPGKPPSLVADHREQEHLARAWFDRSVAERLERARRRMDRGEVVAAFDRLPDLLRSRHVPGSGQSPGLQFRDVGIRDPRLGQAINDADGIVVPRCHAIALGERGTGPEAVGKSSHEAFAEGHGPIEVARLAGVAGGTDEEQRLPQPDCEIVRR